MVGRALLTVVIILAVDPSSEINRQREREQWQNHLDEHPLTPTDVIWGTVLTVTWHFPFRVEVTYNITKIMPSARGGLKSL
jgi:hypothetical protein